MEENLTDWRIVNNFTFSYESSFLTKERIHVTILISTVSIVMVFKNNIQPISKGYLS
jgi:hypothetical protein